MTSTESISTKGSRLLVAEDEPLVRKTIVSAARSRGFVVAGEVHTGLDAVTQALALQPDAILMDIEMPGLDGLEATRRIQLQRPTPTVIVTAHDSPAILRDVADCGAGAFVLKPPDAAELAGGIAIAMARHSELIQTRQRVSRNELLVREMHHRVASQMSATSALLHLQTMHVRNASARAILLESENRLRALARIHARLQPVSDHTHILLGATLSALSRDLISGLRPDLDFREAVLEDVRVHPDLVVHCALLTHELIMNCIRHAFSSGTRGLIQFSLVPAHGGHLRLSVKDNGSGLRKGFTLDQSGSLGLMIVSTLARDLKGRFSITPRKPGTECVFIFNPNDQEPP